MTLTLYKSVSGGSRGIHPLLPMDSSRCSRSILAGQREGPGTWDDWEFFHPNFCETNQLSRKLEDLMLVPFLESGYFCVLCVFFE